MRRLLAPLTVLVLSAAGPVCAVATGQTPASLAGEWRADLPLPDGVVQTFAFDSVGGFHLIGSVAVAGTYVLAGHRLIQSVATQTGTVSDTVSATVHGDSLTFAGPAGTRTLQRVGQTGRASAGLPGSWTVSLGNGLNATYTFARDGTFQTQAVVSDESGRYSVNADTLRLTSSETFRIPALTRFRVRGDTLVLTPPRGPAGDARTFHRVRG